MQTKNTYWIMLLRENGMFCIFAAFSRSMILKQKNQNRLVFRIRKFLIVTFWRWRISKPYIFNFKKWAILFWNRFLKQVVNRLISSITCQNLNWKIFNFSMSISNLYQPNVLFTTFSALLPWIASVYKFSSNKKWHSPVKQNSWTDFHTDSDLFFALSGPILFLKKFLLCRN